MLINFILDLKSNYSQAVDRRTHFRTDDCLLTLGSGITICGTFRYTNSAKVDAPPLVIHKFDLNIKFADIFIKTQKSSFSILFFK